MSNASSDRAVRKALLQAHAEIERIELAQRVADVREAASPRVMLQRLLPFSIGRRSSGDGNDSGQGGSGSMLPRVLSQASTFYHRYPVIWSTAATWILGRSRFGKLFKLAGLVFTARKALQASRTPYRP